MTAPSTISFGEWTLNREAGELERAGARVRLQNVPLQILCELLDHPGDVVTREQLSARLWPKVVVDFEANLNSGMRRLRAALEDDAETPRYIETIPRRGYRYIGPAPAAVSLPRSPAPSSEAPPSEARTADPRRTLRWLGVGAAIAVSVLALVILIPQKSSEKPAALEDVTPEPTLDAPRRLRLAVLPLANLTPDASDSFFADGLHEEILSTIANHVQQVEVISRTTMIAYRSAPRPLREIAAELQATHVLEGSVRRDTESVRLTLQLIDARNDTPLWSQTFNRPRDETIRLQADVAAEVGLQLAVKLSGNIGELPQSVNPVAHDLYLQALASTQTAIAMRSSREQDRAEASLSRAIALDPDFGAAYLQRARVRMSRFLSSQDVSETNLRGLRADLTTARKLIGDSPPVLASDAQFAQQIDFDTGRAMRLLRAAQAVNPNSSEICRLLAQHLSSAGRVQESLEYFERAAQLDPGNPAIFADWASALKMAGRADEAIRVSREFDGRHPGQTTFGFRLFSFTGDTGRFEAEMGRFAAAGDSAALLQARFDLLLFSGKIADLGDLIEQSGLTMVPQSSTGGFSIPAIGRKPVAELHGWSQLLAGNSTAADDGRAVLEYVAREPVNKWNAWYLRMLEAEGALFMGDKRTAIENTRRALRMAPRGIHPGIERYSRALAARIFAWAGAEDEAMNLLEQLSTEFPMLGPAEITRDPLYKAPLRNNIRYQALVQKLDAEVATNMKLLDSA
jgi:TolB-like protein/DNA-binding winged helix-turn-helix (wHTH) protein